MKASYQRPTVETVSADSILESLGPVSCGSYSSAELSALGPAVGSGGKRPVSGR